MRVPRQGAITALLTVLAACKHPPSTQPEAEIEAGQAALAAPLAPPDGGLAPARCSLVEGAGVASTLADVGDRRLLVVGDSVPTTDGAMVGIVHSPATGAEAQVAHLAGGRVEEWVVVKRGELAPDAPPPKGLVAGGVAYAAYVARGGAGDAGARAAIGERRLVLEKKGAGPIATYPDRAIESLAFDAAVSADAHRAAIVWDMDAASGASSGITVGVVPLSGGQALAPRVVSGDTADPDAPRIAPRTAGGWWVAWTAHRPAPSVDASAAGVTLEAPAEGPVFSWVEVAVLADDGAPTGPPRRLTSMAGHAASFDLAPRPQGALDLVIRDETQQREGGGGRILHVVYPADGGAEEVSVIVPVGVGRGSVDLMTSPREAWLTFSDAQDRTLILPLDAVARSPRGAPSIEDALEGGRLLAPTGESGRFLGAFPGAEGALFREVACTP